MTSFGTSCLRIIQEDASIVYSPANSAQFDALAAIAADGLIPGVPSISIPANVPIPFRDYLVPCVSIGHSPRGPVVSAQFR